MEMHSIESWVWLERAMRHMTRTAGGANIYDTHDLGHPPFYCRMNMVNLSCVPRGHRKIIDMH